MARRHARWLHKARLRGRRMGGRRRSGRLPPPPGALLARMPWRETLSHLPRAVPLIALFTNTLPVFFQPLTWPHHAAPARAAQRRHSAETVSHSARCKPPCHRYRPPTHRYYYTMVAISPISRRPSVAGLTTAFAWRAGLQQGLMRWTNRRMTAGCGKAEEV